MHLRQLTHLTAAPPPPSSPTIETTADYANVNAAIQVVTTILIIIMAVAFVLSSLFFCFHRSIAPGCCGIGDGDEGEHDHRGDGRRRRTPGLTRAVIDTFPTYLYSDVRVHRLGNGELECAVCLSQFKDVEILRLLPTCCHVFHPDCIDKWLLSRPTCPVCRADVGSISNLAEHGGGFQSIFGIASSDDGDHDSIHIDQQSPVQIRSPTPEAMIRQELMSYPKAHSTGHSPAWTAGESDRFTLRLPDQVRDKLVTSGGRPGKGTVMGPVSSPRSWYRQRGVAGWCRSGSHDGDRIKKHNYHRFKARNVLDRFAEPVASSNVLVSPWSGSHESDGPIDYSTLVNGQREEQYA